MEEMKVMFTALQSLTVEDKYIYELLGVYKQDVCKPRFGIVMDTARHSILQMSG